MIIKNVQVGTNIWLIRWSFCLFFRSSWLENIPGERFDPKERRRQNFIPVRLERLLIFQKQGGWEWCGGLGLNSGRLTAARRRL